MNPFLQLLLSLIQENQALSADEQAAIVRVAKEVSKALTIAEFKLGRAEKEKRAVSILLEETIDELQQKSLVLAQANTNLTYALSEIKAAQEQLIQKEKLASLGELIAGIAHEIQNPLNFVNNFSEVSTELIDEMQAELDRGDPDEANAIAKDLKHNLHKITHHGQRASSIVRGMLEHARSTTGERGPTDLNALADEYLRLAYHGMRAKDSRFNCELITHFDAGLGRVNIVAPDIGRVLLNLYNNAFYALAEKQKTAPADYKPTLTINTRLLSNSPERASSSAHLTGVGNGMGTGAGNGVGIEIRDNGTGIPDAVKDKIFQPFFTTKPTGEGTGLGLSLSYDIITKGHGGEMRVETIPGEGTEFVLILPV